MELLELGWRPFFQQQISLDELDTCTVARVVEVQRSGQTLWHEAGESTAVLGGRWFKYGPETRPTVGDWVLFDENALTIERLLDRASLFKRMSPSTGDLQLIAANVDILFVVTSCNQEFNISRLERYIALALESGAQPVVVLTKADLTTDAESYVAQVHSQNPNVVVELVNAHDVETLQNLLQWCVKGQTVALMGSSGVGKSTLVNTLIGADVQATAAIREADGRGRHTTSHRALIALPEGGLLIDCPGMRELGIADLHEGVVSTFDDIEAFGRKCRFSDCAHESEPDCAVQKAVVDGELDSRRLDNYRKLLREELYNTESIAERHKRFRQFSKTSRQAVAQKKLDSQKKDL